MTVSVAAEPISGTTRLAAVIGSPVRHSLSPALHNAAFAAAGLDWRMVALEVAPGHGAEAVAAMRTLGIAGLAVTTPHKDTVAAAVDEVDPAAAALGAVNTVVLRPDGSTFGASTDGDGFVESLVASGHDPAHRKIAVLGAGGAARSIIDALGRRGASQIVVINRDAERGKQAARLAPMAQSGVAADITEADILVNATTVGMTNTTDDSDVRDAMPVDGRLLRSDLVVADIVYHPRVTALLAAAERVGAPTVDGLGMLVYQACLQQRLWTGVDPDPAVIRAAADAARAPAVAPNTRG